MRRKKLRMEKKNQKEKSNHKLHSYKVCEKVLMRKKMNKYEEQYKGPYPITHGWANGTVTIRRGAGLEQHPWEGIFSIK